MAAAKFNLGLLCAQGRGLSRNPARALALWEDAAQRNHAPSLFKLGELYFQGSGGGGGDGKPSDANDEEGTYVVSETDDPSMRLVVRILAYNPDGSMEDIKDF